MQQVVVPQFLDVEDKVIGPITVRQFIEMLIAAMLTFIFYKVFDFSMFAVLTLMVVSLTILFAFIKVNGQPFHFFLLNYYATFKNPKLKVWKKAISREEIRISLKMPKEHRIPVAKMPAQPLTHSKISELALIIDTGGVYMGE